MNVKTKTIIHIIVALVLVMGFIVYVYAQSNNSTSESKLRENCSTGSVDACNEYIKVMQTQYNETKPQLDNYSAEANKAREIIKQQLSWTFM